MKTSGFFIALIVYLFVVAPGAARSDAPATAAGVLARISKICDSAQSLTYKADVSVAITSTPGGVVKRDSYTVTGKFQHDVYVRLDEYRGKDRILTLSSNPEHMYLYSPVTNVYQDFGNVPVYFAIWDMLMSGGSSGDNLAPTSVYLGYVYDITGFSGRVYCGDSPWGADHVNTPPSNESLRDITVNGKRLEEVEVTSHGHDDVYTWTILVDPSTGLPTGVSMVADGPSLDDDKSGARQHIVFKETYESFQPSKAILPPSGFDYTPPPGATKLTGS